VSVQLAKSRFRLALSALTSGNPWVVLRAMGRRVYGNDYDFELRRDLSVSVPTPATALPVCVRPVQKQELERILSAQYAGASEAGIMWRKRRLAAEFHAPIQTCYIAVTQAGEPCFLIWLFSSEQNAEAKALYGAEFTDLRPGEVLFERAFTLEGFRRKGIMSHVVARLAEIVRDQGARWAITYIYCDNKAALNGFEKAGFSVSASRIEQWRLLRHSFRVLPVDSQSLARPISPD